MNETRVIERLNQKHSSGRKRVVLCGQREIEGERGREGMERECVKERERERGGREGGKNTGIHTQ